MNTTSSLEKDVVVFIHSTGTLPSMWAGVPDGALGRRRRVAPTNIGYPPGPLVDRGVNVSVHDDVKQVLAAIPEDASRVHLVSHSYGGLVGLHMLEKLGPRIGSMFFYEPVLFGALHGSKDSLIDHDARTQADFFIVHPWFLKDEEKAGRAEWLEIFIDYWNRPGSWSRMPQAMREQSLAMGWKMSREVRSCALDNTSFDQFEFSHIPTTLMIGERSPSASRVMSKLLAKGRSNVTLVEGTGLNHMAPLVAPTHVHEEIRKHFARVDAVDDPRGAHAT